jgi:biopolymer transport protein ExbB/TolQ
MENITLETIAPEIAEAIINFPGITTLIRILQAAGIAIIIYFVFLILGWIIQYKKFTKIVCIERTLDRIEELLKKIEEYIDPAKAKKEK